MLLSPYENVRKENLIFDPITVEVAANARKPIAAYAAWLASVCLLRILVVLEWWAGLFAKEHCTVVPVKVQAWHST